MVSARTSAGLSRTPRWGAIASFEYRHEVFVPAPRDEVYAWWTDFKPDDHAGERTLHGTRTDLRREGDAWTWTDLFVTMGLRTRWRWRVALHPPQWEELHGETKLGRLDGIITFQEVAGGTRVEEVGTFSPTGLGKVLARVLRRPLVRLLSEDFKEHWEDFARERGSV